MRSDAPPAEISRWSSRFPRAPASAATSAGTSLRAVKLLPMKRALMALAPWSTRNGAVGAVPGAGWRAPPGRTMPPAGVAVIPSSPPRHMPVQLLRPCVVALAACAAALPAPAQRPGPRAENAPADSARAERVLRGLRPVVEAVGRPPTRWTLAERMAFYRVPGVSIAVVEGGRVS